MQALLAGYSSMFMWALFIPLFQIMAAVHAIKTGRAYHWIWIILFFPMIGAVVYFFVEVAPTLPRGWTRDLHHQVLNYFKPGWELEGLREEFETCNSAHNRQLLAEALIRHGNAKEAQTL